ncbi:MAG: gamma-glutamyltransferase [Elainella sp.]
MLPKLNGAVAAGHTKTVEAGLEMLRLGGNAFDAAVAGVMTSFVVEPTLTSPAGGGFLLAHTQTGQNILFDFFTQTPQQKRDASLTEVDFYPVQVNFGTVLQEFHIGLGSVAVPGTIGGLLHVHRRLGRLPLATVAEPAIHYARAGVSMTEFQAYCFGLLRPILLANSGSRQVFAPTGDLPLAHSHFAMPDLADSLSYLVSEGAAGFYQGEIGRQLVQDCQTQGGYLTWADLQTYRVIERQPLVSRYRGHTVLTNPPPSSGGALISFALALLESVALPAFGTADHLALLAHVMQLTNLARSDGFDQNLYSPDVAAQFLAPDHLAIYRQQLLDGLGLSAKPAPQSYGQLEPKLEQSGLGHQPVNKWGSTTHLSAIDSEGNAASVTTSNGEGSGYVIPGTGIMTNNMLGEADLHPHGFHNWQPDVRISSMMAPTMILRHDKPEIVLGSGGSNRIRTAILQVISNLLDFGMPIEQAVSASRVHWEAGRFNLEPGLVERVAGQLISSQTAAEPPNGPATSVLDSSQFPFNGDLEIWSQQNMFFGGVHAVSPIAERFAGAGDGRRHGVIGVV